MYNMQKTLIANSKNMAPLPHLYIQQSTFKIIPEWRRDFCYVLVTTAGFKKYRKKKRKMKKRQRCSF